MRIVPTGTDMPDFINVECQMLLKAYGADLVLTLYQCEPVLESCQSCYLSLHYCRRNLVGYRKRLISLKNRYWNR